MVTSQVLQISLREGEKFVVKHPQRRRTYKVNRIEVHKDAFWLFGDPSWLKNKPHLHEPIRYGFRTTNAVPMPYSVAQEVQRCLNELKALTQAA